MEEEKGIRIAVSDPAAISVTVDESLPPDHVEVTIVSPPAAEEKLDDLDPIVE